MAGEWVVGGAEAKGFSFVLVFLALEAMVEGYWNRMWLLLGGAAAFHILVGGWAAVAAGAVWMLRKEKFGKAAGTVPVPSAEPRKPLPVTDRSPKALAPGGRHTECACYFAGHVSCWIAPLVAFLLALPGLVPALLMNRGVAPAIVKQANQIYVFERFPHHLNPAKFWDDGFVLPFLWIVGLVAAAVAERG